LRASAAVWHSDSVAMTWLPVHAVADRRYAWLRATSRALTRKNRIEDWPRKNNEAPSEHLTLIKTFRGVFAK